MWKRIHSNRDPRDTLYSEVRNEFGTYFEMAANIGRSILAAYPKMIFTSMVLLMLASVVLVLTVFKPQAPVPVISKTSVTALVSNGFSQIIQATAKIRETMLLKHLVDSISGKRILSRTDTITLDSALNSLQRIRSHSNN